ASTTTSARVGGRIHGSRGAHPRACSPGPARSRGQLSSAHAGRDTRAKARQTTLSSAMARPRRPFYNDEHEALRDTVRRFVAKEIRPHADEWDEAGCFPRELYTKAGEVGLLGLGFPET